MSIFSEGERRFLTVVADLGYCNPFLPERVDLERQALGRAFVPGEPVWSASVTDPDATRANVARLQPRLERLIESVRQRLGGAAPVHPEELQTYEECVHQLLYSPLLSPVCTGERPLAVLSRIRGGLETLSRCPRREPRN